MSHDIETAVAGSLGGFFRFGRKNHTVEVGTPCANCGTPLQGPWCYACGQLGEDFHRSTVRLVGEAFEGLLHVDGRLWTTLPDLARNPARLTKAYLEGHRAPQIPPLRLFLVVLLLVFVVGSLAGPKGPVINTTTTDSHGHVLSSKTRTLSTLSPQDRAEAKKAVASFHISDDGKDKDDAISKWLQIRVQKAIDEPERFQLVIEQWGERFAFLTLPLSTLLLSAAFIFQRRFFVFDHVIFSLHSLSAMGILITAASLLRPLIGHDNDILFLAAPVHLFLHMRGVYATSVIGTLARMLFLFVGTLFGGSMIFLGLLAVGLSGMG
jgi:hypothetical protein